MDINDRVISIMCFMAEHGFVTINEIIKHRIPKRSGFRYADVLNTLELIDSFETHLRPKTAYYLTDAGYKYLESIGKLRVMKRFVKSDYRLSQFSHTILALQIRLIFESHPYVMDYRSEKVIAYYQALDSVKELARKDSKQCDAEIIIQAPQRRYKVGLELELTSKSFKRLIGIIKHIDVNREDLNAVLWVTSNDVIIKNLQRAIKTLLPHLRNPNKHFFALWNDLNTEQLNTVWYDAEGRKTKLFD